MNKSIEPGFRTSRGYQMFDQNQGRLSPALEDYLEMIYRQCREQGYTRVGKISEVLQVRPSSASKMIYKLGQMGYIKYDRYDIIQLTEDGKVRGEYLLSRHETVSEFLRLIGSENILEEVEMVEHPLSKETVQNLKILIEFFQSNSPANKDYEIYKKAQKQEGYV